jgi:hypothetical protein
MNFRVSSNAGDRRLLCAHEADRRKPKRIELVQDHHPQLTDVGDELRILLDCDDRYIEYPVGGPKGDSDPLREGDDVRECANELDIGPLPEDAR